MSRLAEIDRDLEEAKGAVDSAFPDLTCLRCGNDAFDLRLLGPSGIGSRQPGRQVLLTCKRCGKEEAFDFDYLAKAQKPIVKGPSADG